MDAVGYRIAQSLHAAIGTPAKFSPLTIDGTAKVLTAELMGGSSALTGRPDFHNATFVMLIGSNPVVSHGHTIGFPNPTGAIRGLAARAQVWVVDPRRTETARLATRHLAPRPGTDYAVLAYLVREVLRYGADPDVPSGRRQTGCRCRALHTAAQRRRGRRARGAADTLLASIGEPAGSRTTRAPASRCRRAPM
jgi:anaerobic selenocysteine-containing dehydrogenase